MRKEWGECTTPAAAAHMLGRCMLQVVRMHRVDVPPTARHVHSCWRRTPTLASSSRGLVGELVVMQLWGAGQARTANPRRGQLRPRWVQQQWSLRARKQRQQKQRPTK